MNKLILSAVLCVLASAPLYAITDEEKGLQIAKEVDQADTGWGDTTAQMKMILKNSNGDESIRDIRLKVLEVANDGDKSLTIFDTPNDVKGTAFLSYSHINEADDQWLYLPALKRVKRISSSNKSGPFMGSQFAYEDLSSFEVDKYSYKYIKDDTFDGKPVYVIESYPKYKKSGYTKLMVWVDQERKIPLKTAFYDRKNSLLKTLEFRDYQQHLNKFWRAHHQVMSNVQNKNTTELLWSDFKFNTGLTDNDFNRGSLKRIR